MKRLAGILIIMVLGMIIFQSCASTKMIPPVKVKEGKSVRIYFKSESFREGLVLDNTQNELIFLDVKTREQMKIPYSKIRRVDYIKRQFDYSGEEISQAEIRKYKENKHFVAYTAGGFVLGGLGGILVGLPLWYAETGVKPLFTGGVGAIGGAIFFGIKGNNRDQERAVEFIRLLRKRKQELKQKQIEELKKLEQLKKEKERLKKQLEKRKKGDRNE